MYLAWYATIKTRGPHNNNLMTGLPIRLQDFTLCCWNGPRFCVRSRPWLCLSLLAAQRQATPWVHGCVSNHGSWHNKANLRDLLAATSLVILLKLDSNRRFFSPYDLEIWWMTSKNYRAPLLDYIKVLCIILNPSVNSNWSYCPETLNSGQNQQFIVPCDLEIWPMTLKNNWAPLLCCFKLCASLHSQWWNQTKVTVRKRSIRVKIGDLLSRVTLKFDGWPWKTIGHLFYVASSFVHHFIAIGEFKLELESGNAQSGSNATLFRAVWPWNLTDDLQKQ